VTDTPQTARKPLAEGIPTELAWRAGRRIYVRCGYQSTLNTELRDIGARWDNEVRALWLGSGKADKVIPLVRARIERVAAIEKVKADATANGWWLSIPVPADVIRAHAKDAQAVYDGTRKAWAARDADTFAALAAEVRTYKEQIAAAEADERAEYLAAITRRREVEAADAKRAAADRETAIIEQSGRTVIGDRGLLHGRLDGYLRSEQAEKAKPQPGEVRRLRDGRRVLVLSCTVSFYNQDAIDDGFSTGGTGDEPGWYWVYAYVPVALTDDEQADETRRAAEQADHDEIHAVMTAAKRLARPMEDHERTERHTGQTITAEAPSYHTAHNGKITVTADSEAWYSHPGYYDDYRALGAHITDPALLARIHAILAAGARRRGQYEIKTDPAPEGAP
jgi:hypothetical protein